MNKSSTLNQSLQPTNRWRGISLVCPPSWWPCTRWGRYCWDPTRRWRGRARFPAKYWSKMTSLLEVVVEFRGIKEIEFFGLNMVIEKTEGQTLVSGKAVSISWFKWRVTSRRYKKTRIARRALKIQRYRTWNMNWLSWSTLLAVVLTRMNHHMTQNTVEDLLVTFLILRTVVFWQILSHWGESQWAVRERRRPCTRRIHSMDEPVNIVLFQGDLMA